MFIVLELGVTFVVLEYLALLEDSIRNNLIVTDWMVSYFLPIYGLHSSSAVLELFSHLC